VLLSVWTFIKQLVQSIRVHNIGMLAAVIAFFGFSSTIPLTGVLIYGAMLVVPSTPVEHLLTGSIHAYVPDLPDASMFLSNNLMRLNTLSTKVSFIGILGLVWTVVGGFVSLQQAMDIIWNIRHRRTFILQYVVGFAMLVLLLLLTVLASVAMALTPSLLTHLFAHHPLSIWIRLFRDASYLLFPILLFLTSAFCYRFLPSRAIEKRYIAIGAAVTTLALYASRLLFVLYTHHLGRYELIYGTLTFIMLFAFWIYIVSAVLLFGAEVAVNLHVFHHRTRTQPATDEPPLNPS